MAVMTIAWYILWRARTSTRLIPTSKDAAASEIGPGPGSALPPSEGLASVPESEPRPTPPKSFNQDEADVRELGLEACQNVVGHIGKPSTTKGFADMSSLMEIDLYADEYVEAEEDAADDSLYKTRREGRWRALWRLYDALV